MNVLKLINLGSNELKNNNIRTHKLDSEILLSKILNKKREDIIANLKQKIDLKKINEFNKLISRRSLQEPIAYIINEKEFWSKKFEVNTKTLIPRPETELILYNLVRIFSKKSISILDIGTGSGCILISLLSDLINAKGIGIDISEKALNIAKKNASKHGVFNRIKFYKRSISDLYHFKFDLTTNNNGSSSKILNKVDLNISKFSTIGLMGETGSGKSTLGNILIWLIDFKEGNIISDGINTKLKKINWSNRAGYVPQNVFLINSSIKENVAFGIPKEEIDETRVIKSINLSQLDKFIDSLPDGLNTIIGERGSKLSGGQIQRIGIARALYNDPEFLVLDEPTSALDSNTEKDFFNSLKNLYGKKTIFIISHRPNVLKECDVVYKLEKGKLNKMELS